MSIPAYLTQFSKTRLLHLAAPLSLALIFFILLGPTAYAQPFSCSNGNLQGFIENDTVLTDEVFVTGNVTVRNDATVTIEPGTIVTICGDYLLRITNATLIASGTVEAPITFDSVDAAPWGGLRIGGGGLTLRPSILRHVTINNAGSGDGETEAALYLNAPKDDAGGPTLEHVTIMDSASFGLYVFSSSEDGPPLSVANMTVTGSGKAPIWINAESIDSLGAGNTFTDNAEQMIVVDGDRLERTIRWQNQPLPFHVINASITVRGADTVLTIDPGTQINFEPERELLIQDATLIAEGTTDSPILFDSTEPDQKWLGIEISNAGGIVGPSVLRHIVVNNGGGNDPTVDSGAITIYAPNGTIDGGPILDQVTVNGSGNYGLFARTPSAANNLVTLVNLTINNSGDAPIMLYNATMSGLGTGHTFDGNGRDEIEVRGGIVLGGIIEYSQRWPKQPVPYHIVNDFGGLIVRGRDVEVPPILTLDPGVTLQMGEGTRINVSQGGFVAEGTASEPITITRAANAAWDQILIDDRFDDSFSSFRYVIVEHAGNELNAIELSGGSLSISNSAIRNNAGSGIKVSDGFLEIYASALISNAIGVEFTVGSRGVVRDNIIALNPNGGIVNTDSRGSCVDAVGNYWGAENGPSDTVGDASDCGFGATNSGNGDGAIGSVLYQPWLPSAPGANVLDNSLISPSDFWIIADGIQQSELIVTMRDETGQPVPDKEVTLSATLGTLVGATGTTDQNGQMRATISSTEAGQSIITAYNNTDDKQLAAMAYLNFWQGVEAGGLIDPTGAPFESPEFIVDGRPFQQGSPILFQMPMQNTQTVPLSVTVTYGATGLNIGTRFTPVATAAMTLQPGEQWNAEALYTPELTGHQCVEAKIDYTTADGQVIASSHIGGGSVRRQKNLDFSPPDDPCKKPDATKLIPTGGGLFGVGKHFGNGVKQSKLVANCVGGIGFRQLSAQSLNVSASSVQGNERSYQIVAELPAYTPVPLVADDGISEAQANAATDVAASAAEIAALESVVSETLQRIQWAGQAGDATSVRLQMVAYSDFATRRAAAFATYAERIDLLLGVTQGAGMDDQTFTQGDYITYLEELKATGYAIETMEFLRAGGLSDEEIDALLQLEIEALTDAAISPISLFEFMKQVRNEARLEARQPIVHNNISAARNGAESPFAMLFEPVTIPFEVGNPTDAEATVNLNLNPISLPIGWSYNLSNPNPVLPAGGTTTVEINLIPGGDMFIPGGDQFIPGGDMFDPGQVRSASGGGMMANTLVEGMVPKIAVEGFIDSEFVGGIVFETGIPTIESSENGPLYLPVVMP